jgi:phosphoribosylaminoimidazole carboxylase PurE protein
VILSGVEVAIVMGSESDRAVMEGAGETLKRFGISYSVTVMSAHRNPEKTRTFARTAARRGTKVIIAGAGMAAHLPGVIASHTTLPVIGVPLGGSGLGGLDSLCSIVQMPRGVPVATVAVGSAGAYNAAVLAAEILAVGDPEIRKRIKAYRRSLAR